MDPRTSTPDAARGRRRRAPHEIWSATSTVEWVGADGRALGRTPDAAAAPASAVKAKVHYRVEGRSKKRTLFGPHLVARVAAFQAMLAAAYANNWPADADGRPQAPVALPTGHGSEDSAPVIPASPAALPSTSAQTIETVEDLVKWYCAHTRSTPKRWGGRRSPTTTGGYGGHLDFFLTLARYPAGDPRLARLGVEAGARLRVDDPATGIAPHDLIAMLETRANTNLRTRTANEARMNAWAGALQREEKLAAREGRRPSLPPVPEPEPEVALSRTVEAFAQPVRAMFVAAHKRGLISYQPWTADVDDETPRAPGVHYTAKSLPTRNQTGLAVEAMRGTWRRSTTPEGHAVSLSGDRFAAMVWVAGREAPRPEETIAIRDSWVLLDDGDPRIELHWAEVYHPNPDGPGRIRAEVPLKHRQPGEIRVLRPEPGDEAEFVKVLSEHRRNHVATPDPESTDPEERDPHFFTTHSGLPIDLSNWSGTWWRDAARGAFAGTAHARFADLPFRRLRAAAITDWLVVLGYTTNHAATKAGNSAAVLEAHYKGVLDTIPVRSSRRRRADELGVEDLVTAMAALDSSALGQLTDALRAEHGARMAALDSGA